MEKEENDDTKKGETIEKKGKINKRREQNKEKKGK